MASSFCGNHVLPELKGDDHIVLHLPILLVVLKCPPSQHGLLGYGVLAGCTARFLGIYTV
ncbi:MAG: hypothetical protein RI993_1308 [Pseudomonadota bacterium]|jgi:hypothetical protein